jgi:hypothetical protein
VNSIFRLRGLLIAPYSTAVVLVDPPLGNEILHHDNRVQRKITIAEGDPAKGFGVQYPSLTAKKDLPDDPDHWLIPEQSPSMQSIFEEILYVYSRDKHVVTEDPTSCTTVVRRLTLSMWIGWADRMRYVLNNTHKQLKGREGNILWQEWLWQDIVGLKADLEYILIFLYRNVKALEVRLDGISRSSIVEEWEVDEWKLVGTRFSSLQRDVDGIASIWTQAASLNAIQTAYEQSSSVGQLTTLATVFLPLGLIVGVFSMGGEYAVGQSKFWMFFAISIPLGVVISFLLFTNIAPKTKSKLTLKLRSLRKSVSVGRTRVEGSVTDDHVLPLFNKAIVEQILWLEAGHFCHNFCTEMVRVYRSAGPSISRSCDYISPLYQTQVILFP